MHKFYMIEEVGTNKYLGAPKSSKGAIKLAQAKPTNFHPPILYRTKQGATYAMNYYLGEIDTRVCRKLRQYVNKNLKDKIKLQVVKVILVT